MGARPVLGCVPLAPLALLLQTYSRYPEGKHRCLELVAERGIGLPDTPVMAVHRGRIDLLEARLARDPQLSGQRFSHEEIYPPEAAVQTTLLGYMARRWRGQRCCHICVDFDEIEIARWLIEQGADVNARAAIDAEGFGGIRRFSGVWYRRPI